MPADSVVVARIGRAHGLRGEVSVEVRTDTPEQRFVPGAGFVTEPEPGRAAPASLVLRSARDHNGVLLLAFEGVLDRSGAEALRGLTLAAAPDDPAAEEDAWYESDLVGMAVADTAGVAIGEIAGLEPRPAQDLLVIALAGGGRALVPFVRALVPVVDVPGRRIVVDPPEGLLELERD